MDVNETLRLMREAIAQWHLRGDTEGALAAADQAIEAAHDLDEWFSRGGYLPRDWNHARP